MCDILSHTLECIAEERLNHQEVMGAPRHNHTIGEEFRSSLHKAMEEAHELGREASKYKRELVMRLPEAQRQEAWVKLIQ